MPTSCISVTAKNTAHQLPAPCSPGEFLPGQEMPDSGDRVCAAPRPRAQRGTSRGLKARGTLARGGGWDWGLPRGGGGGTRLSPQLTRDGGGRCESTASWAPKASGQAHLAGPHAWLRATHPGLAAAAATKEGEEGKEDSGAQPPPQPGSGQLLRQQSPHYQTGQAWGRGRCSLQPARPTVPVCLRLQSGPNRNLQHRHPSASRGPKPDSGGKETAGRQN